MARLGKRATGQDRGKGWISRFLPMGYLASAVALVALLLPSALRPPLQQPDASGAFSPNSPSNKSQTFYEGSHGASGGAYGNGNSSGGVSATPTTSTTSTTLPLTRTTSTPPPKLVASDCPYGFGNPPRQIPSVYAPPCAPAFTGSNGGSTAYGVTGDTIRICFLMQLTGASTTDGELPQTVQPGESSVNTTYTVLEQYFNSRLQLYGRKLQFYYVASPSGQSGTAQSYARADKAKEQDGCFASIQETNADELDELARDHVLTFTLAQLPESYFEAKNPYIWSFTPSASNAIELGAQYYCAKLAGRPPTYTDDPSFNYKAPRKVGLVVIDTPQYGNMGQAATQQLEADCGVKPTAVVSYDLGSTASGSEGLASDMLRLKAAGVTTIFYLGDLISAVPFTDAAQSNSYYPEWFLPGFGGVDTGTTARDYNSAEWKHAFGFSFYEVPEPLEETDCYEAFHSVDPNSQPDSGMCTYMWDDMVQMFGGFQKVGPDLTVPNFEQTLFNQGQLPPNPPWHIAGGYSPENHTFPLYASEMWWDANATGADGQSGAYMYLNGGKRYTFGQWPAGPTPGLFSSGMSLQQGT